MSEKQCVNCPGRTDHTTAECWVRASLPDGYMPIPTAEQLADALENVRCFHDLSAELIAPELLANLLAAPTVKAEQPDCVYCQGHGDVTRISGQTAESYSEHNEECPECKGTGLAPSLPAAGSAVEEVEVVAVVRPIGLGRVAEPVNADSLYLHCSADDQLMTVAQHSRIVAALSAQQSAHVSVPRELLERVATHLEWDGDESQTVIQYANKCDELAAELSALLNGGEA